MALWMAYALLVGGLVGTAGVVAEWALRARGYPGRFAWIGSFVATVALPALALLRPSRPPDARDGSALGLPLDLLAQGLRAVPAPPTLLERAEPWLAGTWIVASVLLGSALVGGLVRLSLKARRWPTARSGECDVLLSDGFGPALLGVSRPRVVLPRWALGLEPEQLRLIIVHEEEHRRTGDARVLLAAALAVVAAPWNVTLWWQLRRLRAALELDCDARVLHRGASPAAYGALLLGLGSHIPGLPLYVLPVAALSNPPSLLERRLKMIVRGARRHGRAKALLAGGCVILLLALACETPSPTGMQSPGGNDGKDAVAAPAIVSVAPALVDEAGNDPLVFVDEVLVPGRSSDILKTLDPSTIQRIEVIKGGAARTMMGEAGAGGIVRITTTEGGRAELTAVPEGEAVEGRLETAGRPLHAVTEDTPAHSSVQGDSIVADTLFLDSVRLSPARENETIVPQEAPAGPPADVEVDIDGTPFHGDLSTLDPHTIDRVEVVKSASAGKVIHITTKKAARGGGEES